MQTVTFSWNEPTTRTDGKALAKTEIKNTEVLIAVAGTSTFVSLATVLPGTTAVANKDLADGNYIARMIVTDTLSNKSDPVDVSFTIKTPLAPPSPVGNAKAVVS